VRALEPGLGDRPVVEAHVDAGPLDRGPVDAGPVRRLVAAGLDEVRSDLAEGREVVGDVVRSVPGDAVTVARTVRPVARAVTDRAFAGIPDIDDVAQMGGRAVARGAARLLEGRWLDFSAWGWLAKYRMRCEA
jgi:hypothetical protein